MNAKELEDAVISVVQEVQIKLGMAEGAVSLYMPLDSICTSDGTMNSEDILTDFTTAVRSRLGDVDCVIEDDRIRITVPEQGCLYAASLPVSPILKVMVDSVLAGDDVGILRSRLNALSDKCVWDDVDAEEFDHVVHFEDGSDSHVYCIKDESGHITYHRFSRSDYSRLGFGVSIDE